MMFNYINCFRLALTTSFIFGCCCPSNEQYRELQENALCENGQPLVFYTSEQEVAKATLDEFSKSGADYGIVIAYDPNDELRPNLLGRYQYRLIKTDLNPLTGKQIDVVKEWVQFKNYYETLVLPPKEVRKLLRDAHGIKLSALDVASINAAFTAPTRVELNKIDSNQFAIVCVPIYGYLAILNDKDEFVDIGGNKASIYTSARSFRDFYNAKIGQMEMTQEQADPLAVSLLPDYITDKDKYHLSLAANYFELLKLIY